jgi:uncharacterized protein
MTAENAIPAPIVVVRAMYDAIAARDYEAGFALLADDFVWHEPAQAFHGGTHRGYEEIRQRLETQLEMFDEFTIEPEEFRERGNRIAVPVRQRARGEASGVEVEIRIGHVWTLRDGKIARLDVFGARDDALRALETEGAD